MTTGQRWKMSAFEVNFDGLVGPTHNHTGQAHGNLASAQNALAVSNPKVAAQQGLAKMKQVHDLGLHQGVFPPQERPDFQTLKKLGFRGNERQILQSAHRQAPEILMACYAASSMWVANAATVSPSADTADNKVHFTPANLFSNFHRSLEPPQTAQILETIFRDASFFHHHDPLPMNPKFSDEGAANHTRFCRNYHAPGVELFVYGSKKTDTTAPRPAKFSARQSWEASTAISRLHQLNPETLVFAQQNPQAIDAGVFHNDVISVGNLNVFLFHSLAFVHTQTLLEEIQQKLGHEMIFLEVPATEVSLGDAVQSYLFNSQLITLPSHKTILISPVECQENETVRTYLEQLVACDNPISEVHYLDLRQSMKNGGGPACLRLRVVLTETEIQQCHPSVFLNASLYRKLTQWVDQHYRDRLHVNDLIDPQLLADTRQALDELTQILDLGAIYSFQKN